MNEHFVISSWLGTDDSFLALGIFFQSVSLRIGDHRGRFIFKRLFLITCTGSPPAFGVEEDTWYSCNLSVNGFNRSNKVSSTSFSRSKIPLAGETSMDGTAFCLVTATTGTKFSMLHSINFLPYDDLGVSPNGHEQEEPSSLHCLPNDSTDGESNTKCAHR